MEINQQEILNQAIAYFGSTTNFAKALGVSVGAASFIAHGKRGLTAKHCMSIEIASGGLFHRKHLRPDIFCDSAKIYQIKIPKTDSNRFWKWVDKSGNCWMWTAGYNKKTGYGSFSLNGKNIGAHRAAWELTYGKIPDGMDVLHRCDIRRCVRPDHFFLGTQADNNKDRDAKGRSRWHLPEFQTHLRRPKEFCKRGHALAENSRDNGLQNGKKIRCCEICRLARAKKRYLERKAKGIR